MRSLSIARVVVFAGCLQVFLCLSGLCLARSSKTTASNNLELLYAELQKLEYARATPVNHETALDNLNREKEIERELSGHGAEGITFLLEKATQGATCTACWGQMFGHMSGTTFVPGID